MAKKIESKAKKTETAPVNVRSLVEGFNPKKTDWTTYCKSQKDGPLGKGMNLNETGLDIQTSGNAEENANSVASYLTAFQEVSGRWEATPAYGLQHYNGRGIMHNSGIVRLDNQALAKIASQVLAELASRAAPGDINQSKEVRTEAQKLMKAVMGWASGAVENIKNLRKDAALKAVEDMIATSAKSSK